MSHKPNLTTREVFQKSLDLQFTDTPAQADLFAEDGVMEFPFTPQGLVQIKGREAIRSFLKENGFLADRLRLEAHEGLQIYDTDDPEVIIAEYTAKVTMVPIDRQSSLPCIKVLRVHKGQIVLYRDYTNPLAALSAMGKLEVFAESLLASGS